MWCIERGGKKKKHNKTPHLGIGLHGVMKWSLQKNPMTRRPDKFLKLGCWLLTSWPVNGDLALSSASSSSVAAGDNFWQFLGRHTHSPGRWWRGDWYHCFKGQLGKSDETNHFEDARNPCSSTSATAKSPFWYPGTRRWSAHAGVFVTESCVKASHGFNVHVSREEWMSKWQDTTW